MGKRRRYSVACRFEVAREAELYEQIGRLRMEMGWLREKLAPFNRNPAKEGNDGSRYFPRWKGDDILTRDR